VTPEPPSGLDWLRAFDAEVQRQLPLDDGPRWLLEAHAAFESGWGTSFAFRHCLNPWNITAGPYWHGGTVTQANGDTEYAPDGTYKGRITQVWRAYPTVADAIEDFWVFVGWPRYLPARDALERADAEVYAHFLGPTAGKNYKGQPLGGFYTLNEKAYTQGLLTCLRRVTAALRPPDPHATPVA
jgi:hypothetical protein